MPFGPADLLLHNAKFITIDHHRPRAGAVAVKDDRIIGIGESREALQGFTGPETLHEDLGGKAVIPGIIDSHNHIVAAGRAMDGVLLFDAKNMVDVKELVAKRVTRAAPGEWIQGAGWIESQFEEHRPPTRWELDEAAPNNPVILNRLFGGSVCNSKALAAAGITSRSPDPPVGTVVRDRDSREPSGYLRDGAQISVRDAIPKGTTQDIVAEYKKHATRALGEYVRWGITSVIDPGSDPYSMRAYQELCLEGTLVPRVNMMPVWWGLRGSEDPYIPVKAGAMGVRTRFGDRQLSIGALKMAIDGGLGSKTAMMYEPWIDGTRATVPLRLDMSKLQDYFEEAHRGGWSVGIHTIGDKAQDIAVETFARVMSAYPRHDVRHNIVHGYFPTPRALDVMKRYNIGVSVQPGFIWVEGDIYYEALPEKRLWDYKPLKTYLDTGIIVAANSDMTSAHYNPFLGMCAAVTRKTRRGRVMGEEQRLSVEEMLPLFTLQGAKLTFEEDLKGSIEVGKLADLAVLSDDITAVEPDRIKDLTVVATYIGGRKVYDAQKA